MSTNKYIVALEKSECEKLKKIIKKGKSARVISRAHTLLMAGNHCKTDQEISKLLYIHGNTVFNIRKRYVQEGLKSALYDDPRPGQPHKLGIEDEAYLISLACTDPPKGNDHWTLDLLVEQTKKDKREIKRTTMYNVLLNNELKPWREKNVVHTKD